jgi:cytochrome c oxidase cbb3-type subunit 3/ubiquinol-cytochrome c reductase cytochrome c subunit
MRAHISATVLGLIVVLLSGCDLPGRPKPGPEVSRPEAVLSFDDLYNKNCAGCHGANGQNGSATNLANPEYQALIDDESLRDVIAKGEKGTLMPAFDQRNGGSLTGEQIDVVLRGMRARWSQANVFAGQTPPPYKATHAGDVGKGQSVYSAACARCHDATAKQTVKGGPEYGGSILDGSFLALVNEQTVRTTIIAGRPDIGQPDWRNHVLGHSLTDDEVTNVTAWLLAQRPATPGQPYNATAPAPLSAEKPQSH